MACIISHHFSTEAPIENIHYQTEFHQKFAYALGDIQNPKQRPNIQFFVSHHFSTEAPIEKMHYQTEIHRKFVYAFADIQNPKHMPNI